MSGVLPWLGSLDVGIAEMDGCHHHILGLLAELTDQVEAADVPRARVTAQAFLAAMDQHFAGEERMMRTHHYPHIEGHLARHADSRALVVRIRDASQMPQTIGHAAVLVQDLSGSYFRDLLQEDGILADWLLVRGLGSSHAD